MVTRPWVLVNSLVTFRAQVNAGAPGRSTKSDGTIGDTDHSKRDSDHNPWYPIPLGGKVTAIDITHDPDKGMDCHRLAGNLAVARDPRVKYCIWDGHITDSRPVTRAGVTHPPWTRLPYRGVNKHTSHLHLSVVASILNDSRLLWSLPMFLPFDTATEALVTYRLPPTPAPAGVAHDAAPTGGWPTTEEVIATPGPAGGWRGRILMHPVFGWRGAFVEEAWSGPSGKHYVDRYNPANGTGGRYIPGFASQSWELPAGDRFLVIRYAAPSPGSVGPEPQR